jgi:hypothetical protein
MTKDDSGLFGWYKEPGFTTLWNFAADTVNSDITLYAQWKEARTSIEKVNAWLDAQTGGTDADNPLELVVAIGLGDMTEADSGWKQLLATLAAKGKHVNLNLAACAMTGTAFNPDYTDDTGKIYITGIILPNTAESIAAGADNNHRTFKDFDNLKTAEGAGVIAIGDFAFLDCDSLESVNFPAAETIGRAAFANCDNLESVSFLAVKSIGASAFIYCENLKSVNFPAVQTISGKAFFDCYNLESASFPASAELDANPFPACLALTTITLTGSGPLSLIEGGKALVRNTTELVAYPSASGTIEMTGITSIGSYAFAHAELTSAGFPNAQTIGGYAFEFCGNLASVNFPKVQSIGSAAIGSCSSLTSISLPKAQTIGDGAFYQCSFLASVSLPAATTIGGSAFYNTGTGNLEITLGQTAPTVGKDIFLNVTSTRTVTVKVPNGASGNYDAAWQTAFKGKGSSDTGELNANITLNISELPAE